MDKAFIEKMMVIVQEMIPGQVEELVEMLRVGLVQHEEVSEADQSIIEELDREGVRLLENAIYKTLRESFKED